MVLLIGTSGSGKSSFARRHFLPTETLSSDVFRGLVMDDETDQAATKPAFEALHYMLGKRLELGRLTVVDATSVQAPARKALLNIASQHHALKVAIVFDTPVEVCAARNATRGDRQFGIHVLRRQRQDLMRSLGALRKEGFQKVYILKPEDVERVEVVREPMLTRRLDEKGPFDIIGDVHGCWAELQELVTKLGYNPESWTHPEGRRLFFVGDLVDRGPDPVAVVRRVMATVKAGVALAVPGNHDVKLSRALEGRQVNHNHGLKETLAQFELESQEFRTEVKDFLKSLVSHAVLDQGRLCIAHAGLPETMQGRGSAAARDFALYGETTGEIDEFGLPIRYEWAREYRGQALVVYGHTPVYEAAISNNTIDIDTGCCFGGKLTAFRYPEREIVSVPAHQTYAEPKRPMDGVDSKAAEDDLLDIEDVLGRRRIEVELGGAKIIREENAIAALEIMSRFAADPRWLIYLPPTMSPCETSSKVGYLEYPTEALSYFHSQSVEEVVCQEKHMGSRAVAVVCRDAETAARRFGVETGETGAILTRTGRRFFDDLALETSLLDRMARAGETSGLFDELATSWILLDLELMPWSAKAMGLLQDQYAPVGAAAIVHADALSEVMARVQDRGLEIEALVGAAEGKSEAATKFRDAYRRYVWPVNSIDDYKLAPFHILASESGVHTDRNHIWHMETLARLCDQDPQILHKTAYQRVQLGDAAQEAQLCQWWETLVDSGGEGMVVKPLDFIVRGPKGLIQPAVKCRGPEYLRIIYGPEYRQPENLSRLRRRGLMRKRSLAIAEFTLGIEAMERFLRGDGPRRVHECVFGILALESEPVDPRL
jgi:protein phosphatase